VSQEQSVGVKVHESQE